MTKLVSADIEAYAQAHSMPESDLCRALREETQRCMEAPQMIVGPLEGAFLKMMTQLVQATSVLEIGMFTGYSALCFAEALPADGTVLTCEVDEESAALARRYFARSPIGKKIEVRMGPALETMRDLKGPFDLIFIDADKVKNPALPGGAFVNQEGIYLRFATSCHFSPLFRAGHPGRSS